LRFFNSFDRLTFSECLSFLGNFAEDMIMPHVSESTTSLREAIGPAQSQSPGQNQRVSPDGGEAAENGRSKRLDQSKESTDARQVRQTEDRVLISREAQEQTRDSRVDEGKKNVDNQRPQSEQRTNERGAAQKLNDQNEVSSSGVRNSESTSGNNGQEVNVERNRSDSREAAETSDQIKKEAADRKNPETRLREFQNKDEIRIEPKNVSKSIEEVEGSRKRAEAAQETVFETPSQRVIQEVKPGETDRARSATSNVRADQSGSNRQPPSPASVQTETGQNVDDLI